MFRIFFLNVRGEATIITPGDPSESVCAEIVANVHGFRSFVIYEA